MTPKERFLAGITGRLPDRVPCAPDISNYIPAKRSGRPFWDIYFDGSPPLWQCYLETCDYFDTEVWIASCTGPPWIRETPRVELSVTTEFNSDRDAMIQRHEWQTPDGPLTAESTCFRADPPSPTEKPIKSLVEDFPKFRWLQTAPDAIDREAWDRIKTACEKRQQAFGVTIGYPGFHNWMNYVDNGVAGLSYAELDNPAILEEWLELDVAIGTRKVELLIEAKPDYVLFGGSGTITLASPQLARKYALPALTAWSAKFKQAGIPTMLHSCGKARALVEMLATETAVDSVNPLEIPPMGDVDLAEVKTAFGDRISLMGNLHTTDVMLRGSPALVTRKAIEAMRAAGGHGGFVLSTGDQCGRETPDENLFALVDAARQYGVYDQATGTLPELPV